MQMERLMLLLATFGFAGLLSACTAQKGQDINLIWHDGECLLYIEGISAEQAGKVNKAWEFSTCGITVESELGAGKEGAGNSTEVEPP
jgi:hypothetical protein